MGYGRLFFVDDAGIATVTDITDATGADGVSLMLSKTITLNNDQIKALPTTAVEIMPAPGAGKIIVPTLAWLRCAAVVDYGNIDASASIYIGYGESASSSPLVQLLESSNSDISGLLAPQDADDATNAFVATLTRSAGATSLNAGVSGYYDSDIANKSLSIGSLNNGQNYNGGDAGNSLTISLTYLIFNISTGAFV